MNAIVNKNCCDVKNCTIYVTSFPCNNCAKLIIQAGIKKVMYMSDEDQNKIETQVAKKMFNITEVPYK